ncbi:MAG: E3 ubiquitin-protein ligase bre1 [Geoglossum simile]|nr:MAG: E3 ubiquitin-protein ligase bre1 [Geoglossum simile]
MTLAEPRAAVDLPSRGPVKMDDRKRPATYDADDAAPPSKRQATAANGGKALHRDDGMPFKEDLEQYQKEAIWRQMQEYKREKNTLETQLTEMTKRSTYHDDHLRIIDAWWKQLLDEVKLLAGDIEDIGSDYQNGTDSTSLPSELFFADNERFESHLASRSKDIKSTISQLFKSFAKFTPDVKELQARISKLLASEKAHATELDRVRAEKEQLEERLENASLRYMVAEKKLDRAKSQSVAKLERQAIFAGSTEAGGDTTNKTEAPDAVNGIVDGSGDTDAGRREAIVVATKRKEQLEKLESENGKLTEIITTMNIRLSRLSEDDVARSDLFKHLKAQHEDVITRINHLEATNVQLREEAEKLQAERTAYRIQIETESQASVGEMESQLARAETDLARIRTARDELAADVSIRRVSQDQDQVASEHIKELVAAKECRIAGLEAEIERLRVQLGQSDSAGSRVDLDAFGLDELKHKYESLEKEYSMLSQELPSMGAAYKKAQALATKKVMDLAGLEEKVARLLADKSKADQKYFAAMKAKDARENEIRALKLQNSKSSEIVAQLKEAERAHASLLSNLEKQLTETKASHVSLSTANRTLQQRAKEDSIAVEGLRSQVSVLTEALKSKDASLSSTSKACRSAEIEIEKLRTRLEEAKKSVDVWKGRSMGKENEEYEMLRALALCNVCRSRFKNTVIKSCGHIFCKECVDERISSRSRKCPTCGKSFPTNDHMAVHM